VNRKSNLIVSASILIAGIIIGGFLVLGSKGSMADISTQISGLFKDTKNQDPKTIDSDKDGLPDYLEAIYGTDTNNPDTDGDTYLDGEEIMSGYDPLKAGPDDKVSDKAATPRPKPGSLAGVNLTEELAKAMKEQLNKTDPSSAFQLDSTGNYATDSNGDAQLTNASIIDNALSEALAKSPQLNFVPTIQDSDIKISSDDSKKAQEDFTSQMVNIISAKTSFSKLDIEAAQEAMQTQNYSGLDQYINGYLEAFKAIKEISVPPSWKELHKKNLSLILANANILQVIKTENDDPLRTILALQQYQQIVLPGLQEVYEDGLKLIQAAQ
jgi:hypothetical protein